MTWDGREIQSRLPTPTWRRYEQTVAGLQSILLGTSGLGVLAAVALALTLGRGRLADQHRAADAARALSLALEVQVAHFGEELVMGFQRRFPEFLGLEPWSTTFFVAFNGACIVAWLIARPALRRCRRWALFPAWFLALAAIANGIAHPLLAVATRGYFPGLLTSPLLGLAGLTLARRLTIATARDQDA